MIPGFSHVAGHALPHSFQKRPLFGLPVNEKNRDYFQVSMYHVRDSRDNWPTIFPEDK